MTVEDDLPIIHARLVNGEEILAFMAGSTTDGEVIFHRALRMEEIDRKLTLNCYSPLLKKDYIYIREDHILTMGIVHEEVAEYYKNTLLYTSGLIERTIIKRMANFNALMTDKLETTNLAFEDSVMELSTVFDDDVLSSTTKH